MIRHLMLVVLAAVCLAAVGRADSAGSAFAAAGEGVPLQAGTRQLAASATRQRVSTAGAEVLVTGTYNLQNAVINNLFDPAQLAGQPLSVPHGYGNVGGYQDVAVDSPYTWVEFGWQQEGVGSPVLVVGVDITKTLSGYAVEWTEVMTANLGHESATVTLTSDAFAACTGVALAGSSPYTFPNGPGDAPPTQTKAGNTISLTTPAVSSAVAQYQATWLVRCPCGTGVERGTACCDIDSNILEGPCCLADGAVGPEAYPCFE